MGTANAKKQLAQLAAVVAAHLVLLAVLLSHAPTREAMMQIIPVVASIVQPSRLEPPAPPSPQRKAAPKIAPAPAQEQAPVAPTSTQIIAAPSAPAQPAAQSAPLSAAISAPPAPPADTAPRPASPTPSAAPAPAAAATLTPPRSDAAYLNNPKPEYPAASLRLGEAGRVVLNVLVSAAGTVEQVSVRSSSGSERLDQAALKAVRQWKFIPARRGDEAVAAQVLVPITFKTESE